MLPEYFWPPVGIANYANDGQSSASFYGPGVLWSSVKSHWTAGDWVLFQFGYGEGSASDAAVQANLAQYVADAQAAGVNAVLIPPAARVTSIPIADQTNLHAVASQQAAALANPPVPFIDLTSLSTTWYNGVVRCTS